MLDKVQDRQLTFYLRELVVGGFHNLRGRFLDCVLDFIGRWWWWWCAYVVAHVLIMLRSAVF